MIAIFGGGLPACHPAQLSSNSIEYSPDLCFMETDLFAAAIALERSVAADPHGCRATLVSAIWAANDFYLAWIERARRHRTALRMSLHLHASIAPLASCCICTLGIVMPFAPARYRAATLCCSAASPPMSGFMWKDATTKECLSRHDGTSAEL